MMDKRLLDPRFNPQKPSNVAVSLSESWDEADVMSRHGSLFDEYLGLVMCGMLANGNMRAHRTDGPVSPSLAAEGAGELAIAMLEERARLFGVEVKT